MAKRFSGWVILALVVVFGITAVGCDNCLKDGNKEENIEGTFVLTDIPATYEGQYIYFVAFGTSVSIVGCQSINMSAETVTLTRISNGRANIPLWTVTDAGSISRYYGNDIFTQDDIWEFVIVDDAMLTADSKRIDRIYFTGLIIFNNGYAEKSVNNGSVIPY